LHVDRRQIDAGDVVTGQAFELMVNVRNSGNQRLMISRIVDGCNCTGPDMTADIVIPANSTGRLAVKVNAPERLGLFTERARFSTNDPACPQFSIFASGRAVN
jgi:hypothetical protein